MFAAYIFNMNVIGNHRSCVNQLKAHEAEPIKLTL